MLYACAGATVQYGSSSQNRRAHLALDIGPRMRKTGLKPANTITDKLVELF